MDADPLAEPTDAPPPAVGFMLSIGDLQAHVGTVMVEAAAGYRTQLLAHGFTEGAAELMTIDYHRTVLAAVLGNPSPPVDSS